MSKINKCVNAVVVAGLDRRTTIDDGDARDVSPLPSVSGAARVPCTDPSALRPLSATSGYLAAFDADGGGGGCSWLIRARPGQRITVVAYDFGWPPATDPSPPGRDGDGTGPGWPDLAAGATGPACPVIATLEERESAVGGRVVRLCEVRHRRTVVYSSLGHELVIRLKSGDVNVTAAARSQRLFLHYESNCITPLSRIFRDFRTSDIIFRLISGLAIYYA